MNTAHRYWLLTDSNGLYLTATTIEWARLKVAAFATITHLRIEDREATERLEERGVIVE
jgi:hypothetical protein